MSIKDLKRKNVNSTESWKVEKKLKIPTYNIYIPLHLSHKIGMRWR